MDKIKADTVATVDNQEEGTLKNHLAASTTSKITGTAHMASQIFVWMIGYSFINCHQSFFIHRIAEWTDFMHEGGNKMLCHGHVVKGNGIDAETRCSHYHSPLDIIAIKFYCCNTYYPCFDCHKESGCGNPAVWPADQFDKKAVLCGSCGYELTVNEYKACQSVCPNCAAKFNPGCGLHWELYFE